MKRTTNTEKTKNNPMIKPTLCLSIDSLDKDFEELIHVLSPFVSITVEKTGCDNLKGYQIYVGKKLSEKALESADALKVCFAYKTGVDDFPLHALKERKIPLINSHVNSRFIAQYAFSLLLSLVNHVTIADRNLRKGQWHTKKEDEWEDVYSKKVGLLGYGKIGNELHTILEKNGIKTVTIDRKHEYQNIELAKDLKDLIEKSDVIISSLPKTKDTDHLFNEETLSWMKRKYLINVGRSNCIDEEALYQAMKNHVLKGVAIDTWEKKPDSKEETLFPSRYPFQDLEENIILSPHQATRLKEGHLFYVRDIEMKLMTYLRTGTLSDVIDYDRGY